MPFIKWITEVGKNDALLVGGKGANLGEVAKLATVPPGFIVTSEAFRYFQQSVGLAERIREVLNAYIRSGEPEEYEKASAEIRRMVEEAPLPPELERAIVEAYMRLGEEVGIKDVAVAVRSSATAEDIP